MRLTTVEADMLAGRRGEAARRALEMQIRVGEFFGADDLVPVHSAHVMAEMECMREAGLGFVEEMRRLGGQFSILTTTNPRSVDFALSRTLGQDESQIALEQRLVDALQGMGAVTCDTCVNYETIYQPRYCEHVAWGDTGAVIYANSVLGARSNFEGGPVALAAGLTGRVPRFGYHLEERRRGTVFIEVEAALDDVSDWGALGCYVGRRFPGYWEVPVLSVHGNQPRANELKHLGAALASYGSHALFHMVGITPEARTLAEAFQGPPPPAAAVVGDREIRDVYRSFPPTDDRVDLVVFGTPQLSLEELRALVERLNGRRVAAGTRLLLTTNFQVKTMAEQLGYAKAVQAAGGMLLTGVCFYLMTPRELARKLALRTIVTNSAKLANIIAGYGYTPIFRDTATCVDILVRGSVGGEV